MARRGQRFHPAAMGAPEFGLGEVVVPFSRSAIKAAGTASLAALLGSATGNIDVGQTDLVFVTSAYADTDHLRDLILSLVPISPHRLIILDEQWGAQQDKFETDVAVPIRVGVLSTVIGKQRLLGYEGLASIEKTMQLETEVA